MNEINIEGLDKAAVLAALYNASQPLGMGFIRATPGDMSVEEARTYIEAGDDHKRDFPEVFANQKRDLYFDYLNGRVMKTDLSGDTLNTWGFDRDNGQGAAYYALLRAGLIDERGNPIIDASGAEGLADEEAAA